MKGIRYQVYGVMPAACTERDEVSSLRNFHQADKWGAVDIDNSTNRQIKHLIKSSNRQIDK